MFPSFIFFEFEQVNFHVGHPLGGRNIPEPARGRTRSFRESKIKLCHRLTLCSTMSDINMTKVRQHIREYIEGAEDIQYKCS